MCRVAAAALVLALVPLALAEGPPLTYEQVDVAGSGLGHVLKIDLARASVRVLDRADHGGDPLTASEFLSRTGAAAVINGPFFDVDGSAMGLLIVDGDRRQRARNVDWGVLELETHGASILHTRDWAERPQVRGAIQVGPRLVVDGKPLDLKRQFARRTAVCTPDPTHLWWIVAPRPVEANAFAAWLASIGCDDALNLDGGPSTQLALAGGASEPGPPVPVALGVFAEPAPPPGRSRGGCW